ncbi:MAG: N-acetylglucosamine kinase [Candidatus Acidiferrales bacterium]
MPEKVPEMHAESAGPVFLGFDGGGTKTDCVLIDQHGAVMASASAGPSNPLRAGYSKSWFSLSDAADHILERRNLKAAEILGVCAGIAGAGREGVARRISIFLQGCFSAAAIEVTTDLAITLEAAVGTGEGVVLVTGTGSGAFGRNAQGKFARAGGHGPWFSDEGSAYDIGRCALSAAIRAEEGRGPATEISAKLLPWLNAADWAQLTDLVAKTPDEVFPRAFPLVARLADAGDAVSRQILSGAADSLAALAASVLTALDMKDREVPIVKAGGTVRSSAFFDAVLDAALLRVAPHARIATLKIKPAEAAARRALRNGTTKAHAG